MKALSALCAVLTAVTSLHGENFYQAWVEEYDRTNLNQGQSASSVAVDSRGNVIVTGNAPSVSGYSEWYTAKYDGLDGHLLWANRLGVSTPNIGSQGTPTGDCYARSVAIDSHDNVIVTGGAQFSAGQLEDIETVKYSPDGILLWSRGKNGSNSGADEGVQVVIGPSDSVYVGGTVISTNGLQEDFQGLGYTSGGTLMFSATYDRISSNIHCIDKCAGVAVTSGGQVWLTGSSSISGNISFLTVKFDTDGSVLVSKLYTSPGAYGGATGIVLDSADTAFITGKYTDASGNHGFYTAKYGSTGISLWEAVYSTGNSDHAGGAQSIAIGPDDNPVVTGAVEAPNGTKMAVTIKYRGAGASVVQKWMRTDVGLSPIDAQNQPQYDTQTRRVFVDAANNVVVIGESTADQNSPVIYLAKYGAADGGTLFTTAYSGDGVGNNTGVAVTADAAGNLVFAGTEARMKTPSSSVNGIATVKLQRILAQTGDPLPPDPVTQAARTISAVNTPALADSGDVTVRISYKEGKTSHGAILTLGSSGVSLPVLQGDAAPNVTNAKFASFGEPVVSQDGHYAFAAKLSGISPTQASSVWTNLGGTLHLALQQGSTYGGLKITAISSISLHDTQLLALVKAGPITALVGLDAANNVTVLLQTGTLATVPGTMISSNIKAITALSAAPASPGDGRWQGIFASVARATLLDGTQLLYRIANDGTQTPMLYTGHDASAVANGAKWQSFGLPSIAPSGSAVRYAAYGTVQKTTGITTSNDEAIVYSLDGTNFAQVAVEGAMADSAGLIGLSYAKLSDPIINSATKLAFLTTLKPTAGSGAVVNAKNNQALLYGTPGAVIAYVRTGASARDSQGDPIPDTVYSSIKAFSLSAGLTGVPSSPFFLATLSGKAVTSKTNTGLWAIDRTGKVRLLLRTGETLGDLTVKTFTVLKAAPLAFGAQRNVNAGSSVVVSVSFTDHSTGIVELMVP